ncbi:hypothetical protein SZMC14600_20574 [Saccharomonospora azurea SZMC 14600]|nr:hypothetical protein SZMC14600_20574 [Saccharomonospora azurea SZMC 14600]
MAVAVAVSVAVSVALAVPVVVLPFAMPGSVTGPYDIVVAPWRPGASADGRSRHRHAGHHGL